LKKQNNLSVLETIRNEISKKLNPYVIKYEKEMRFSQTSEVLIEIKTILGSKLLRPESFLRLNYYPKKDVCPRGFI